MAAVTPSVPRPSLVLVHGSFGTAAGWSPLKTALEARGYEVHAVELPWNKSPRTGGVPSLQDYVDTLVNFVRSKELKSVALVGHSFGGVPISLATEGGKLTLPHGTKRLCNFVLGMAATCMHCS